MNKAQDTKQRPAKRIAIALLAILAACLAFNFIEYGHLQTLDTAQSLAGRRNLLYAAAYVATYILSAAAIVVCVFSRSAIVRWASIIIVAFFVGTETCSRIITHANVGFGEVNTTLNESEFLGEFASAYGSAVLKATAVAVALAVALYLLARFTRLRFSLRWAALAPVALLAVYGVVWRTVAMTDVYPSPIRIPVLVTYATLNAVEAGPRDPVEWTIPDDADKPRVIVLIVDESIRGDYLSINGWTLDTTPFLRETADDYLNLGIACSASNLSSSTNYIIRTGLRADQIPDRDQRGMTIPSVFQYAQAAGYRTCYLDAQYEPNTLQNFLNSYDFDHIDVTYWATQDEPDTDTKHLRDRRLAEKIFDLADDGPPTFIWVNKYGSHFHYENAYPESSRHFTPTMPPGSPISSCTREQIDNTFSNAIRWAADDFLQLVVPKFDMDESLIVYTSDHGQSFVEGSATHADRIDPPTSQADVPILLWGRFAEEQFPAGAGSVHDQTSHFQIFPSVLVWMGYDEAAVTQRYGNPLWAAPPAERVFLSGDVFGRGISQVNQFDLDTATVANDE